jgi:DNA mismatch endonuclease (patch repair protein)
MTNLAIDPLPDRVSGVSAATRKVMQANRRRDTGPELKVRRYLHARGYRFRVDYGRLPGRPDIALPKHRFAIFVHGCYWHRHGCGRGGQPKTNAAFWQAKFDRNAARHERNAAALRQLGWTVVVVWECSLHDVEAAMAPVMALLGSSSRPRQRTQL